MIVAGTGHRPDKLGGYGEAATQRVIRLARDALRDVEPAVVISGMALGWDQALATAAMQLGIEWWAYVPFEGQENMWPAATKNLYRTMLTKANVVKIICPGSFEAWKMQKRNEEMVDHCNKLLVLWNGSPGGTANCVKYAQQVRRSMVNYWSVWQSERRKM